MANVQRTSERPLRQTARSQIALAPAFIVALTACFALPGQAGGYRVAKWGMFGFALAATSLVLLVLPFARQRPVAWPRPGWALGVFMVGSIGLPALSPALGPTHWPGALGLLSGAALFFVTAIALNTDGAAQRASLATLTVAGTACALLVLAQAAGLRWLTDGLPTSSEFRAPGTLGNPNWAAAFLAPIVLISLGLAATATPSWRRLHHAAAALLALATAATLSKGGMLSLAAGGVMLALLNPRLTTARRRALWGAVLATALATLLLAWHLDWWTTAPWLRGRLFLWRVALRLASEHPLTGIGLGGYVSGYGPAAATLLHDDPGLFMPLSSVDFTHDDVLQLAVEGGLVTAVAFVVVAVQALKSAIRVRNGDDPLRRAAGAALSAIFVNGLADSPLHEPATFALFFFLLGWLAPTIPPHDSAPEPGTRRGVAALLVLVALLGAVQGLRHAVGNLFWTRGRDALRDDRSARAAELAIPDLARARFYLPEQGRIASHYTLALARAGQWQAALEAAKVTNALHFDLDDQMLQRDLQAELLSADEAIAMWQDFAARYPQLLTPQLRLGDLYLERGDRAAATRAYQSVLAAPQDTPRARQVRDQARRNLQTSNTQRSSETEPR